MTIFLNYFQQKLTLAGKVANFLSTKFWIKMAKRSEVKNAKRSFALKYFKFKF